MTASSIVVGVGIGILALCVCAMVVIGMIWDSRRFKQSQEALDRELRESRRTMEIE